MFPAARFRLELFAECGSTQDLVLARRGGPDFHGYAALALRQTAGQGRRGRAWETSTGNLALSFGLHLANDTSLSLVPFACGVALFAATAQLVPRGADLRLKWPNDLYLNGGKLAGILAQGRQIPGQGVEVVVGIGVNLARAPAGLAVPAIALADFAAPPTPEFFARALLERLTKVFDECRDFASLQADWERAARVREGLFYVAGEVHPVRGEALLPTGELLVRDHAGHERKLASEEVSLRLADGARV